MSFYISLLNQTKNIIMEQVKTLAVGLSGATAVGITPDLFPTGAMDTPNIVQTIVQLIIGIVTIFHLFKKKQVLTT